ncbi:hypothetical protein G7046_g2700 [Stylonectria norvegica]|nr:hypothetical protein G7046_g2700 [Stylonectria norvegica]
MTSPVQRHQYPPAPVPAPAPRELLPGRARPRSGTIYAAAAAAPYPADSSRGLFGRSLTFVPPPALPVDAFHVAPTPTSAQSQHQYGPPYAQGSPRRRSASAARRVQPPALAAAYPPSPASPYQQRLSSVASAQVVQAQVQAQAQASPHPPPPLPIKRISTSYESPASDIHLRSHSHSEREHSLSVSPKTRVPSLPNNYELPSASAPIAIETRTAPPIQSMAIEPDRAVTHPKRKLDDRDLSPKELEHREPRPPPAETNGGHILSQAPEPKPSPSPVMARKKRIVRRQPPIWAESARNLGNRLPNHDNFVLQKRVVHAHAQVNGKSDLAGRSDHTSRQATPETAKPQPQPASTSSQVPASVEAGPREFLGPWESSITGAKPYEELSKAVADFLFINVINSTDMQEITSRGIQFEIEAKLGTLIDKDTNHRVDRLVDSECVLQDNNRVAFRSSMTEAQHKNFNDFLNQIVIQTDPRAAKASNRVQVHYTHRREKDRFYELPPDLQGHLPGCMRVRLGSRSKNVRVRVTYDQKTGDVLHKIIKARVADINLHFPMCPMDCRISINLEMDWDGSVEELEQFSGQGQGERQPDRNKDRLSYKHGNYQIDLTQVTHTVPGPGGSQRLEKEHELEVELAPTILIDQGRRAMNGAPHAYQELVDGFIDNVRVLARKARELQ